MAHGEETEYENAVVPEKAQRMLSHCDKQSQHNEIIVEDKKRLSSITIIAV